MCCANLYVLARITLFLYIEHAFGVSLGNSPVCSQTAGSTKNSLSALTWVGWRCVLLSHSLN